MHGRAKLAEFKSELGSGGDAVCDLVRGVLQKILEEEMTEALHVGPVALVRDGRQLLAGEAADSQKASNRGETCRDASPAKPILKPRRRDCRTGLDPLKDPNPASRQLRRAARAHPARAGRSRVGISSSPFDHARRGHPQLLRNAPAAFARRRLLDRAHPQIVRIRSGHPFRPSSFVLKPRTQTMSEQQRESLSGTIPPW